MATFKGIAKFSCDYTVVAENKDQANDFILDMACEDFPDADVRVYNTDIEEINS